MAAIRCSSCCVTYAVFLILEDVIKVIWGVNPYFAYQPYGLLGSVDIFGLTYSVYNLALVGFAAVCGVLLWWSLKRWRWGKLLLAVIHDREMSLTVGINVTAVYMVTCTLGAILAAIGGAFTAPIISVVPDISVEVIVLAFAVVVIGGLGSLEGAALGALSVGIVRAAAVHLLPAAELFIIYGVMALVLVVRPHGLFGHLEVRKI
jgi:branched-chain amino acid transport system permease protein